MKRLTAVLVVFAVLTAVSSARAEDPVLGVPAPEPVEQPSAMTARQAAQHANYELAKRFPVSFLLRRHGRVVCDGSGNGFRCVTAWQYRRYTYRGRLRVEGDSTGAYVTMRIVRTAPGRYATFS